MEIPQNNEDLLPATPQTLVQPVEPTTLEIIQKIVLDDFETELQNLRDMDDILKNATLNLKDLKAGVAGTGFINQAVQIGNLVNARIKASQRKDDKIRLALAVFGLDAKTIAQAMQERKKLLGDQSDTGEAAD